MKHVSIHILVLCFGMISCHSDKKVTKNEEFRIQEPRIVLKSSNERKSFNTFSQMVKPDLTLVDEIQFQEEAGSFSVLYNASCRFDKEKKTTLQSGFLSSPKSIRFLSFLNPEQLRLIGESMEGVPCAFDFVAISAKGSRHYFKLPLVQLKDVSTASELSLLHLKTPDEIKEINFEQWSEHFIKLARSGSSQIALNCTSGEKSIAINQADRFNLISMPLQELPLDWSLGAQTCRISQIQDSVVVGTSKNFLLISPTLAIPTKSAIFQHPRYAFRRFDPYLVSPSYRVEIANPYPYAIRLRLPEQNLNFTDESSSFQHMGKLIVNDGQKSYEWISNQVISLEANKSIVVFHYIYLI